MVVPEKSELDDFVELKAFEALGSSGNLNLIRNTVSVPQAWAISRLMFPRVVVDNDCLILAERFDRETMSSWRAEGLTAREIETVVNHLHLVDVFEGADAIADELLVHLADQIVLSWTFWLPRMTNRIVSAFSGDSEDGVYITFHQGGL